MIASGRGEGFFTVQFVAPHESVWTPSRRSARHLSQDGTGLRFDQSQSACTQDPSKAALIGSPDSRLMEEEMLRVAEDRAPRSRKFVTGADVFKGAQR